MTNPLLEYDWNPPFAAITAEHVIPAIEQLLEEHRAALSTRLDAGAPFTWDNLVSPLESHTDRLERVWTLVGHLNAVVNSDALRDAYNHCVPLISEFSTELGQNAELYHAYQALADSAEFAALTAAQKRVINNTLRDFRLAGVGLDDAAKSRFKTLKQELSSLHSKFQDNVLDATQAWRKHIDDDSQLAGLPESALALCRQTASQEGLNGWLLTLDFPCYYPIMTYADNRELRESVYRAYSTRASDQGPNAGQWDNGGVIDDILQRRHEVAQLLGFANHAELSLATKMAESNDQVIEFLLDLAKRSKPQAELERQAVQEHAESLGHPGPLAPWDINYFAEKLRQHRYQISQEELRPYFPESAVIPGLFVVIESLYGFSIRPAEQVETWHDDVRCYDVFDGQTLRGRLFVDLYARTNKRGGAWMNGAISRRLKASGVQKPMAFIVCNFTPPVDAKPALFTHTEVITLFHEFGHGLHHLLTQVDYSSLSGINGVEWDAVELPSQFMENWCWEREALDLIAAQVDTGEKIPNELYHRMLAARHFQAAMQMVRQLEFALFDFRIHSEYSSALADADAKKEFVANVLAEVRDTVAVVVPPPEHRFAHSFSHIFSGGYAAGYYSYKWAEVLSADAFSLFEENGVFDRQTGRRFLENVLEVGGTRDAIENFRAFRGRYPQIEPLLRHSGIADGTGSD